MREKALKTITGFLLIIICSVFFNTGTKAASVPVRFILHDTIESSTAAGDTVQSLKNAEFKVYDVTERYTDLYKKKGTDSSLSAEAVKTEVQEQLAGEGAGDSKLITNGTVNESGLAVFDLPLQSSETGNSDAVYLFVPVQSTVSSEYITPNTVIVLPVEDDQNNQLQTVDIYLKHRTTESPPDDTAEKNLKAKSPPGNAQTDTDRSAGKSSIKQLLKKAADHFIPKTGDDAGRLIWLSCILSADISILLILIYRKKRRNHEEEN